jgi:hypothetical protein
MAVDFDALVNGPCLAVFGEAWQVNRGSSGPWYDVPGIFTRDHIDVAMGDEPSQSLRQTTLFIRLSDLPGYVPARGDLARNDTGLWQIMEVQPDAEGGALLILGARAGVALP